MRLALRNATSNSNAVIQLPLAFSSWYFSHVPARRIAPFPLAMGLGGNYAWMRRFCFSFASKSNHATVVDALCHSWEEALGADFGNQSVLSLRISHLSTWSPQPMLCRATSFWSTVAVAVSRGAYLLLRHRRRRHPMSPSRSCRTSVHKQQQQFPLPCVPQHNAEPVQGRLLDSEISILAKLVAVPCHWRLQSLCAYLRYWC